MPAMPPDVSAALDELIAGARSNPILMALAAAKGVDVDQTEAALRHIQTDGLMIDEARAFMRALEDDGTREVVGAVMTAIPPDREKDRLMLDWAWGEATRVIAEWDAAHPPEPQPEAQPISAPGRRPWAMLPLTCGFYADRANLAQSLDAVASIARKHQCVGRLGVDIEGTGDLGNPGADVGALMEMIRERFAFIAGSLVPSCIRRGLPVKVTAGNSNDFGKGFKAAWRDTAENRARYIELHRQLAVELLPFAPWVIAQAIAETDGSMAVDFRRAVQRAWRDAGWPMSQMAAEDREGGASLDEHHIKRPDDARGMGAGDYVSTDNGTGIVSHFSGGDVWSAAVPRVDACTTTLRHCLSGGACVSLYHRATRLAIVEHAAAYDAIVGAVAPLLRSDAPAEPTPSRFAFRYAGSRLRDVAWSPQIDRAGWPTKGVSGKECNGLLYGCAVGGEPRKVEWIKVGADSAHTTNAWEPVGTKYGQDFREGVRIRVEVRDINGRLRDQSHAGEVTLG